MQLAARMRLSQRLHRIGLVRGVVVEDEVHVEMGRGLAQSSFLRNARNSWRDGGKHWPMTVPLATSRAANSVGGAIALVVVCHGPGAPLLDGQARLGAVEGLDLALLVNRKHQGFVGRVQIKADDILDLGDEVWVVGDLEVCAPDAA